jgi:CHAT domain-containing protein
VIAFGDPDYGEPPPNAAPSALRSMRERGLDLRGLPASRGEVKAIGRLYSGVSRTYVGREATEGAAKTAVKEASLVHFACHGLADETSPLDSALAFSLPRGGHDGDDNGLLQAWEIFESVRMDADMVTLSACGTALGKEMSGEGILGLTRAFHYAGARTVMASLWAVADTSTAELMKRFYTHYKKTGTKDAALRSAQIEMIRRSSSSHPYHWAAFQVMGDWK